MKKLLSLLLALTMILPLVGCAAFAENADPIMITVIATSDVHGKVLPINYATGEPSPNVGLSMIASMIEQVRATEKNVILVDGGDTVQGSAMTYYYSYFAPEKDDPMMKALRLMDYLGLNQEEAAAQMGVARTTVQRIYAQARRKLAVFLVEGRPLQIGGGSYALCPQESCRGFSRPCGRCASQDGKEASS